MKKSIRYLLSVILVVSMLKVGKLRKRIHMRGNGLRL